MTSQKVRKTIRATSLLFRMVWLGEFACFSIYTFIVYQAAARGAGESSAVSPILPLLFGVLAAGMLCAGLVTHWYTFSQRRARAFLGRPGPEPPAEAGSADVGDFQLITLAKLTFQPYLMGQGMINSCVLFGMVLAMIKGDPGLFLPFLVAGSLGLLLCYPRVEAFIESTALLQSDHAARQ